MGKLTHTVKGPIASFRSADKANIESLKFHFLPKQEGSGDPSPTNIRPITGWTGCNMFRAKKNLLDENNPNIYYIGAEKLNGVFTNTVVDTRDGVQVSIVGYKDVSTAIGVLKSSAIITSPSTVQLTATITQSYSEMTYICIKHNGTSRDFKVMFPIIIPVGTEICVSVDILSTDVGTIGGFKMNNIQIEVSDSTSSYESYSGSVIPLTFPSTRNLLDTSTHETDTHIAKKGITFDYNMDGSLTVNGAVDSDAASGPQYRMAMWTQQETGNFYLCCLAPFSTTYNETYVYDNDLSERPKKWDGETQSQSAGSNRTLVEVHLIAGHTYAVNVRINRGYDKTYTNGKFYAMILRSTDTNTNYEPYGVFYGGYIDPVRGKLVRTYAIGIIDGTESVYTISGGQGYRFGVQRGYTSMKGDFNKPILNVSTVVNPSIRSNRFLTKTANSLYGGEIGIAFGGDGSTIWMCYGEAGMTEEKIRAFLSANPVQLAYELATPVEYDITPTEIQTFLDHNNFWSDANGDTEVEYAFADRLSERKLIMDTSHLETVSAAVASFSTDMKAPVKELKAYFTPVQEGSGDPSPSNVRPIHGFAEATIRGEGKNLIDISALTGDNKVWWKGSVVSGYPNHCVTPKIPVKPGVTYCLNRNSASQDYVCYFDKNGDYVDQQTWNNYNPSRTIPDGVYYVGITIGTQYLDNPAPQFELGSTVTAYKPYVEGTEIEVEFPAMKNLVALNLSPYAAQQNPHATIIKQTADELEFTTHGDYTYEYVRLYYMIPAGTYTAKIYASTIDENDNYSPLLSLYVNGERVPFAGIRNGQTATFTLTEDTVVDMRFFGNLDDSSQRTVRFSKFQLERGSVATDYESRATIYGGYVDLVRNKVVATHGIYKTVFGPSNPAGVLGDYERHGYNMNIEFKPAIDLHDDGQGPYNGKTFCNVAFWGWDYFGDRLHYYIDGRVAYIMLPVGTDANTEIEFCAELATPIEYNITPQILKTLKGTNNIWSDLNGDVEVKYWAH